MPHDGGSPQPRSEICARPVSWTWHVGCSEHERAGTKRRDDDPGGAAWTSPRRNRVANRETRQANMTSDKLRQNHEVPANTHVAHHQKAPHNPKGRGSNPLRYYEIAGNEA